MARLLASFWRDGVFKVVLIGGALFLTLSTAAMPFYPGGTLVDPATVGYSFFRNFFSDLGLTQTSSGQSNTVSAVLFISGLTAAGGAVSLFSLAFPQFFRDRFLAFPGACFGFIAGLAFVGIAWTPYNLLVFVWIHDQFIWIAFTALFMGVLFYAAAIFRAQRYPKRYALIFIGFAVLLVGYLWLIIYGPGIYPVESIVIYATGQKVIVYATVATIMLQAHGGRTVAQSGYFS